MSHTIRVSDATHDMIVDAVGHSGKSKGEVVDDTFKYVHAIEQRIAYEKLTGCCLGCGSKRITKKKFAQ